MQRRLASAAVVAVMQACTDVAGQLPQGERVSQVGLKRHERKPLGIDLGFDRGVRALPGDPRFAAQWAPRQRALQTDRDWRAEPPGLQLNLISSEVVDGKRQVGRRCARAILIVNPSGRQAEVLDRQRWQVGLGGRGPGWRRWRKEPVKVQLSVGLLDGLELHAREAHLFQVHPTT